MQTLLHDTSIEALATTIGASSRAVPIAKKLKRKYLHAKHVVKATDDEITGASLMVASRACNRPVMPRIITNALKIDRQQMSRVASFMNCKRGQ